MQAGLSAIFPADDELRGKRILMIGSMASTTHGPPLTDEPGLGAMTLAGFIREVTENFTDREALAFQSETGDVIRWTYSDLYERSVEVARALIAAGIVKGTRVGVLMTNRTEWVASVFGISLAGGVAVTLNTFATPRELEYLIRESDISVLIIERSVLKRDFLSDLLEICPQITEHASGTLRLSQFPFLRRIVCFGGEPASHGVDSWNSFLAGAVEVPADFVDSVAAEISIVDAAVVFFSSGSTALPKGIIHAHRAAAIQCWRWARILELDTDVRSWTPNGFFWSGNFCVVLAATLAVGGSVILQRFFDPAASLKLMETERVSCPFVWPHQLASLVEHPKFLKADLSSLKYIDPSWQFSKHPSVQASGWRYPSNSFGCSETFTLNCSYPASTPTDIREDSHGAVLPGNTVRIVHPLTGEILFRGEQGEIALKGPTLMAGYLRTPLDETLDGEGFYRTGDKGYVDQQGRLHWEGRMTDVIKTGGANVSPVEVDTVLNGFPGIKIAQTVGVPHETLGEMVVACIIPMDGNDIVEAELNDFLRQRLASYKVPRRILIINEEDVSLTANAKVRVDMLRLLATQRLATEQV